MITELFSSVLSISLSLIGITFIIAFHEFGHLLFAKLFNVYAPTFSIGIGKKLFSKKIGSTEYCVSAGPIGGFVEISMDKGKDGTVGFNEIPYWQKFLITLGGIFFNIILTYLFFAFLFFTGMPDSPMIKSNRNLTTIESVPAASPNYNVLQPGDTITTIDGTSIESNYKTLLEQTSKIFYEQDMAEDKRFEEVAQATVLRNGEQKQVTLQIDLSTYKQKWHSVNQLLNIKLAQKAPLGVLESLKEAGKTTISCIKIITQSLVELFTGRKAGKFAGPIMMIAIGSKGAKKGINHLLLLLAIISINLAIMNFLPLPIFDGGQITIFTIETILGRSLSERTQNIIGTASWLLIIGLLIVFSLKDIYTLWFF